MGVIFATGRPKRVSTTSSPASARLTKSVICAFASLTETSTDLSSKHIGQFGLLFGPTQRFDERRGLPGALARFRRECNLAYLDLAAGTDRVHMHRVRL